MVTLAPKTARLPEIQLPPLTIFKDGTFGYKIRYRIVSEDSNRFSHYSPVHTVVADYSFERPASKAVGDFVILRQGPYVNVVWDAVTVKNNRFNSFVKKENKYDVWLRWSGGENNAVYVLADRVDSTLQGFVIPSSYQLQGSVSLIDVNEEPTRLSVEIYIRSTTPSRNNSAFLVYRIDNFDIEPPLPPPSN
jgi:hypothetical protein